MINICRQAIGMGDFIEASFNLALKEIKDYCKRLNTFLEGKTFFVGQRMTMADLSTFTIIKNMFALVLDAGFRKAMPALTAWFQRMAN